MPEVLGGAGAHFVTSVVAESGRGADSGWRAAMSTKRLLERGCRAGPGRCRGRASRAGWPGASSRICACRMREAGAWPLAGSGRLGLDIDPGRLDGRIRKLRLELLHLSVRAQALLGRHRGFCSRCRAPRPPLPATLFTDPGVDTTVAGLPAPPPHAPRGLVTRLRELFEKNLSGVEMADVEGGERPSSKEIGSTRSRSRRPRCRSRSSSRST